MGGKWCYHHRPSRCLTWRRCRGRQHVCSSLPRLHRLSALALTFPVLASLSTSLHHTLRGLLLTPSPFHSLLPLLHLSPARPDPPVPFAFPPLHVPLPALHRMRVAARSFLPFSLLLPPSLTHRPLFPFLPPSLLRYTGCGRLLAPSPFHSLLLRLHPASSFPIFSLMLLSCFAPLPAPQRMRTAARPFTSPPPTAMQASSASCAASGHPRTLHPRSRCVVNTTGLLLKGCLCLICFAARNMVVAKGGPLHLHSRCVGNTTRLLLKGCVFGQLLELVSGLVPMGAVLCTRIPGALGKEQDSSHRVARFVESKQAAWLS